MFILISAQIGGGVQPITFRIFSLFIQIPIFSRTQKRQDGARDNSNYTHSLCIAQILEKSISEQG